MIDRNCPCCNKLEMLAISGDGLYFCIYNNTIDFDCSKCQASKEDKADAIYITNHIEKAMSIKRKRR